jgi:hypothetical protein
MGIKQIDGNLHLDRFAELMVRAGVLLIHNQVSEVV